MTPSVHWHTVFTAAVFLTGLFEKCVHIISRKRTTAQSKRSLALDGHTRHRTVLPLDEQCITEECFNLGRQRDSPGQAEDFVMTVHSHVNTVFTRLERSSPLLQHAQFALPHSSDHISGATSQGLSQSLRVLQPDSQQPCSLHRQAQGKLLCQPSQCIQHASTHHNLALRWLPLRHNAWSLSALMPSATRTVDLHPPVTGYMAYCIACTYTVVP